MFLIPRRHPLVRSRVPLRLVTPLIKVEMKKAGEYLERIVIRKSGLHFFNISIHTRSVKRELRAGANPTGTQREGAEP